MKCGGNSNAVERRRKICILILASKGASSRFFQLDVNVVSTPEERG